MSCNLLSFIEKIIPSVVHYLKFLYSFGNNAFFPVSFRYATFDFYALTTFSEQTFKGREYFWESNNLYVARKIRNFYKSHTVTFFRCYLTNTINYPSKDNK